MSSENGQTYDPRRRSGWPTMWLPKDIAGLSGEHVDWETLPETSTSFRLCAHAPQRTPEMAEVAA
jgi:hypothetical protein